MSYRHIDWAMTVNLENPTQRLVLIAIANFANIETGECFPSRAAVQKITGFSAACITRTCRRLSELGLLTVLTRHSDSGRQTSNNYVLPKLSPPTMEQRIQGDGRVYQDHGGVTDDQGEGIPGSRGRVYQDHPHSLTSHLEPVIEPRAEPWRAHSAPTPTAGDRPPDKSRGTRLPEDWRPDDELVAWAIDRGVSHDHMDHETEKFRNYWLDKPGASGRKVGWNRTWQNWIIKSKEDNRGTRGQHRKDIDLDDTSWFDPERAQQAAQRFLDRKSQRGTGQ